MIKTLKDSGTLEHQLVLVHKVLTEGELAGIGVGLGLLESPFEDERVMKKTSSNINQLLRSKKVFGSPTNDAIAFQKTVFLLMAPTAPNEDAPYNEKAEHDTVIKSQAKFFLDCPRKPQSDCGLWLKSDVTSCPDNTLN